MIKVNDICYYNSGGSIECYKILKIYEYNNKTYVKLESTSFSPSINEIFESKVEATEHHNKLIKLEIDELSLYLEYLQTLYIK